MINKKLNIQYFLLLFFIIDTGGVFIAPNCYDFNLLNTDNPYTLLKGSPRKRNVVGGDYDDWYV